MQPLPDSELVVPTPERVSFDYQVAGLGTRAIAQVLDLLVLGGLLVAVYFVVVAALFARIANAGLIALIGGFVLVFGYFWVSESIWSGQTIGKKAFRLRAVGDRGEPLTFAQAGIRNIVRIADFLPYGYGVGLIVLFANGRGKRLGDLAAGTIVVKDSDHVWLWQLPGARTPATAPAVAASPIGVQARPPTPSAAASAAEMTLRRLDPELRRFVTSYARRRPELSLEVRVQLATQVQASLRGALPDVFTQGGPLAALDRLADLERQ